jgi:hypothetical protein
MIPITLRIMTHAAFFFTDSSSETRKLKARVAKMKKRNPDAR